jgi:putative SOS response-associated peptidase YedK
MMAFSAAIALVVLPAASKAITAIKVALQSEDFLNIDILLAPYRRLHHYTPAPNSITYLARLCAFQVAWREVNDLYDLVGAARNLQAHCNIAPTDTVEVVRRADGATEFVPMRWGLVPWWRKKSLKQLPASFNARAESVADKPMFRDAFRRHRCIIPARSCYEWEKRPDGKRAYFISATDGGVLSFAGLWDRWKNPETGELMTSCTIIVTDANGLTRPIHDRMPVVLDKGDVGPWLSGAAGTELLKSAPDDRLRMWSVSKRVNKTGTGDDDPTLVDEVAP